MFTDLAATLALALGRRVELLLLQLLLLLLRLLKCYFDWSSLAEPDGGGVRRFAAESQSSSFRVLKSIFMFSWRQVPRLPSWKKSPKKWRKNKNNVDDNTNNNSQADHSKKISRN